MAIKRYTSFELVLLAVTIILLGQEALRVDGDLCQETHYKTLCRSVVKGITNPVQATEVSIKALISETIQVKEEAKMIVDKTPELDVCDEEFGDAVDELNTSLKYLANHDKNAVNNHLSAALTGYVTCDDAFADSNKTSPLAQNTTLLGQMGSNCLALATQIQ